MLPLGPTCLTPLKLAAIAANPLPPAEMPPRYAAPAECIAPQQLARQEQVDGTYDQTTSTEHFLIAWDADNAVLDAHNLQVAADALEDSWATMVDTLGWYPPDQTESCLITVVLADMQGSNSGTGGWTNVNAEHGVPYMVINTDWFTDDLWTETLLAHEFNHASQFAYNVFWDEDDWWYWESTAEWSTELPYPDANMWTYSLWAYLDAPYLALDSEVGLVNYGHFTFNVYLQEQVVEDAPLQIWEAATPETDVAAAFETALGEPLADHLGPYTSHVAAMDVADRETWLAALTEFDVNPYVEELTTYPAKGEVEGKKAPQGRGQNFFHLGGEPGDDVAFVFRGAPQVREQATDWELTLATRASDGTVTHTSVRADETGEARVVVEGLGDTVADAYVGIVSRNDYGRQGASYSWAVGLGRDYEPPPDDEAAACACNGVGGAPGLAVAVALGALARRRRG